jgi:hypothetical protein
MNMTISKPEPEKGSIKVCTNTIKSGSSADGMVKGSDPHAYLGHFRTADVMKRGHNVGAPGLPRGPMRGPDPSVGPAIGGGGMPGLAGAMGGSPAKVQPMLNAETNPIAATRQAKRSVIQSAKASGMPGAVKEARAMGRSAMAGARETRQARNAMGLRGADVAALKGARQTARAETKAPAQAAKAELQGAVSGLHAARQATRAAVRGGNYAAQAGAVTERKTARQAVKAARKGLRAARK